MNKRIISLFLVICMAISFMTVSYAQEDASDETEAMKATVSYFNIMNGDPDGNFRLSDNITRAEFSKVGVAASKYKDYVAPNAYISPFKDVKYTHWAAPYVKVALDNGIMAGYEDGTFRPDKNVTIEEVITVYMRLLGYTDEEFGLSWPYGQISTAKDIGLCDGVEVTVGSAASRKDVLILSYNLLSTDMKGTNSDYISVHNHSMVEDIILLDSKTSDAVTKDTEVVTTSGTYKVGGNYDPSFIGLEGDICVDTKNNRIVSFVPNEGVLEKHIVYKALTSEVVTYKDGVITNVNMTDVPKIYDETNLSTLNNVMLKMKTGDVMYVKYDEKSSVEYMIYKSGVLKGPITIKGDNWANELGIDVSKANITRNGIKSSVDSITADDIIYYSPELSVIMAYSKKVTGIYEKATPNRDMPASVTISGVTYPLEGVNAFNALSSVGDIKYGDKITVFLGKDGVSIADAKKIADGSDNYNYIISKTDDLEGPVTADNTEWYSVLGIDKNNITVVRNGVKSTFDNIKNNDIVYYSDDYDALFVYSNKITGIYEKAIPNNSMPTSVVVSGKTYSLEDVTAFNAFSSGGNLKYGDTIMLLMGKDGVSIADAKKMADGSDNYNYIISKTDDLEGPITVKGTQWYTSRGIDTESITVIRNGEKKTFNDIQNNDIVYYSDNYNALFVYSNKITGIYEKAKPNKEMPTSVVVSGVEYLLEDVTAFNALSSGGTLKYGDTITLLMGKDGLVADAVGTREVTENVTIIGYLMATGQKTYQDVNGNDYSSYYASILFADGSLAEYKTSKDYKDDVREICSVTFDGAYAKIKAGITGAEVSGKVDSKARKIGKINVSDDVDIIDLSAYEDTMNEPMKYKTLYLQRLDGTTLSSRNIVYAGYNESGEIDTLILNNFTGDALEYGLVTKVNRDKDTSTISYSCMIDGNTLSASGRGLNVPPSGEGAKIVMNSNNTGIYRISTLYSIMSSDIASVSLSNIISGDGTVYTYADDVQVYKMTPATDGVYYTYARIPLTSLSNLSEDLSVNVYYDKKDAQGGRIRVIVVKERIE